MPPPPPTVTRPASVPASPPERVAAGTLVLRRARTADADAVAAAVAASMDHLRAWMPWATLAAADPTAQRGRLEEAEEMWDAGSDYIYSVLSGAGQVLIGTIGLHRRVRQGGIEIGYWIHADYAGQGNGTAAARALTGVALALPDVRWVEIHCDAANAASAAIPRKLGYRLDRVESRKPTAPGEQGSCMVWIMEAPSP